MFLSPLCIQAFAQDSLQATEGAPVFSVVVIPEDTMFVYVEYKSYHFDRFAQNKQNFLTYSFNPKFSYLSRKSLGFDNIIYFKNGKDEYLRLHNQGNSILPKLFLQTKHITAFEYKRQIYLDLKVADSTNSGSRGAGIQQKNSVYWIFMKSNDTILWCKSGQCDWEEFMGYIPASWTYSQVNSFSELANILFADEKSIRDLVSSNTKGYRWKDLYIILEKYSKAKSTAGG